MYSTIFLAIFLDATVQHYRKAISKSISFQPDSWLATGKPQLKTLLRKLQTLWPILLLNCLRKIVQPYAEYPGKEEEKQIDFTLLGQESYYILFSMRVFECALVNCKEFSPGPDDILYSMVKHAAENTKISILSLINRIIIEHCFPCRLVKSYEFCPLSSWVKTVFCPPVTDQ